MHLAPWPLAYVQPSSRGLLIDKYQPQVLRDCFVVAQTAFSDDDVLKKHLEAFTQAKVEWFGEAVVNQESDDMHQTTAGLTVRDLAFDTTQVQFDGSEPKNAILNHKVLRTKVVHGDGAVSLSVQVSAYARKVGRDGMRMLALLWLFVLVDACWLVKPEG
jgi:hypothetical protein